MKRRKTLSILGLLGLLAGGILTLAADTPKVPEPIAVEILKAENDQLRQANQMQNLAAQYKAASEASNADEAKLQSLKADAYKAAGVSADDYDLNFQTLEFVAKPKAPAAK